MLNRRDALWGLALTVGAGATGLAGRAAAAATLPPLSWTPTALTPGSATISFNSSPC